MSYNLHPASPPPKANNAGGLLAAMVAALGATVVSDAIWATPGTKPQAWAEIIMRGPGYHMAFGNASIPVEGISLVALIVAIVLGWALGRRRAEGPGAVIFVASILGIVLANLVLILGQAWHIIAKI